MILKLIVLCLLLELVKSNPPQPEFKKKIQTGKKTVILYGEKTVQKVQRVFVTLVHFPYTFKKKKVYGKREDKVYRVQFVCIGCEKCNKYLTCFATVNVIDFENEASDEYILEKNTYPQIDAHDCAPCGLEEHIESFKKALLTGIHENPVRALPELYDSTRIL